MNFHAAFADLFLFAHDPNPFVKAGSSECPPKPDVNSLVPLPNCPQGTPKPESIAPSETIAYVLADLAIILIAARIVGAIFVKLNQPRVVGEIISGILIGATVLGGHLSRGDVTETPQSEAIVGHGLTNDLYPLQAFAFLNLLGLLTLVFFMFLVGLEVQQRFLKGRERQIAVVALAVLLVPVGLGFVLSGILDGPDWKPAAIDSTTHSLILGAALAVTAFPVMARILQEKRMIATDMGATGVGAAAVVTPLMFIVLAGAAASAEGSGVPSTVGGKLLLGIGLILFLFLAVRPFLKTVVLRNFDPAKPLSGDVFVVLVVGALATGLAADRIGINSLNGGFLFGACVPQIPGLAKAVIDRMSDFVIVILIPVFLAVAGIQTDFTVLTIDLIPGILLFLAAMIIGKWGVGAVAGRAVGLRWKEANAIGVLMNCRGLMILVVAIVASSFGGITPAMRVVFALGAIVTTVMTGPLVDVFLKEDAEDARDKTVGSSIAMLPAMTGGPRVILVPGEPIHVAAVGSRALEFLELDGPPPQFMVVDLPGLSDHGEYVGAGVEAVEEERSVSETLGWLRPLAVQLQAAGVDAEAVSFVTPDREGDLAKLTTDWGATHAVVALDGDAEALDRTGIRVHRTPLLVPA